MIRRLILFAGILLLSTAVPVWATVPNLVSFKQAYPAAKGVSCKTCHQNPVGRKEDLNPYGKSFLKLKAPTDPKKLKLEDFRAIEKEDADEDGISNLEEIKAGTPPGGTPAAPKGARLIQDYLDQVAGSYA